MKNDMHLDPVIRISFYATPRL